jgi:hypothetical protein
MFIFVLKTLGASYAMSLITNTIYNFPVSYMEQNSIWHRDEAILAECARSIKILDLFSECKQARERHSVPILYHVMTSTASKLPVCGWIGCDALRDIQWYGYMVALVLVGPPIWAEISRFRKKHKTLKLIPAS